MSFIVFVLLLMGCTNAERYPTQSMPSATHAYLPVTQSPSQPIHITARPSPTLTPSATLTATASPAPPTRTPTITATPAYAAAPLTLTNRPFIGMVNLRSLAALVTITPPDGRAPPQAFTFAPDGASLLLQTANTLQQWDIPTGGILRDFQPPADTPLPGQQAVFSPDGKHIARIYNGREIVLWDANNGEVQQTWFASSDETFLELAYPQGVAAHLAVALSRDGVLGLRLWDVNTGNPLGQAVTDADTLRSFLVSPNGRLFLMAGQDGILRFFDPGTSKRLAQQILYACPDSLNQASYSQDSQLFAVHCTAGENSTAQARIFLYWPNFLRADALILGSYMESEHALRGPITFNRYDELMAVSSDSPANTVMLWNIALRQPVKDLPFDGVRQAAFSPDGRLLAILTGSGSLELWGIAP